MKTIRLLNDKNSIIIVKVEREKEEWRLVTFSTQLVTHACNPSYSGGRDQKDHGSEPAWANSSRDPILKIPNTKQGWWSD
jgi:hypothetical protein